MSAARASAKSSTQWGNTPSENLTSVPPDEIEVTDPAHPLYGRRFAVLSITRQPGSPGFVLVAYGDTIRLRIPVPATNLATGQVPRPRTKCTAAAIRELLSLFEEVRPSCRNRRTQSGRDSRQP
jgi:hypothetical protein